MLSALARQADSRADHDDEHGRDCDLHAVTAESEVRIVWTRSSICSVSADWAVNRTSHPSQSLA